MVENEKTAEKQPLPWMGGIYSGTLVNNKPHGTGRLLRPDGTRYEGEWVEGKPHGFGSIYYTNGATYQGGFLDGRMHGTGVSTLPDGKKVRGKWANGNFVRVLEDIKSDFPSLFPDEQRQPESEAQSQTELGPELVPGLKPQPEPDRQMSTPAISVNGLSHWYNDLHAVKDISFSVYPGEILGFLGPNGAGKSTTIKVLTGQLALKSGQAQILGRDIGKDDPILQSQIGVTFEEKNLYLEMTALENLDFYASLFGIRRPYSLEALRRVGLSDRARDRVSNYSKGMRQRLMIARAFINKPKVLFLDEPTDGLDPVTAAEIRKTIKEEAERGAAVLLTTHNMHEADELSDRVAFINEGEIVAIDTAENLKLKYGKRSVRVRLRDGNQVREEELPLDGERSSARLSELAASPNLLTIHTEEATLEAIFIRLTGRGLAG